MIIKNLWRRLTRSLLTILGISIGVAAVVALGFAIRFVDGYLDQTSEFIPKPMALEIDNPVESRDLTVKYSGVYATRIDDGEMLLELKRDGTWGFYDVRKGSVGSFILQAVKSGNCRPVYEAGRLAILTDTRYLFYPENDKAGLVFQDQIGRAHV